MQYNPVIFEYLISTLCLLSRLDPEIFMQSIDNVIHAKWMIPGEGEALILEDHSLAIVADKIVAILPTKEMKKRYQAKEQHTFPNHAVLPGFINAHTHLPMNLFRGLADDLPLMDWLKKHIWPAETKWVHEDFIYDGSLLAMAEMIRCGTTCCNDMYFYSEQIAKAAETAGLRAHVGITIIDIPTRYANSAEAYFERGIALHDLYKNHPLIQTTLAPHSTYTVSIDHLIRVKEIADQFKLKINIHLQEDPSEIALSMQQHQMRPLERLNLIDMVSPNLIAIHMTQLNEKDYALLSEKKPHIIHCPESNMKLSSGLCEVEKLDQLGINVALGTDGAASNNDLDMIGEMRTAAFLGKIVARNPTALAAEKVLKMATINGAKALGIDAVTGSLQVGKSADLIAIAFDRIESQPLYHPLSQIVYTASRNQVTDVWVAGKQLMRARKLLTLNEKELLKIAKAWSLRIKTFS